MNNLYAIILGIVQGLTEFLPISSSGHLVLFQRLMGLKEPELLFDISVHIGTLVAICLVFYNEITSIISAILKLPSLLKTSQGFGELFSENQEIRMAVLIFTGSIPTAILGILFSNISSQLFSSVWLVALMLVLTGTILWATRFVRSEGQGIKHFTIWKSLIIGLVQGFAIIPGVSRSGSTIAAGLFVGVERETAARYSFLLSIPAIIGAFLVEMNGAGVNSDTSFVQLLIGAITSAVVGFVALKLLLRLVRRGHFFYFAPYCWLVGSMMLIWLWL
jgi:undecaprenyl-diphosphatase